MPDEDGLVTVGDLLERNMMAFEAVAKSLEAEGRKESGRSKLGRRIGVGLGIAIAGIGAIPAVLGIEPDASWIVGAPAVLGFLVGLNSQILSHEERHKKAEQCSFLSVDTRRFANDLTLKKQHALQDEKKLSKLLEEARQKQDTLDKVANEAGLKTNPYELITQHLAVMDDGSDIEHPR